jgi:hypothetical protein
MANAAAVESGRNDRAMRRTLLDYMGESVVDLDFRTRSF